MAIESVVLGALGRMGTMLRGMIERDPELKLVGVTERSGNTAGLEGLGIKVSDDLDKLLPQVPGAVVIDFTAPEVSVRTGELCAKHGNPAVIGTTGLSKEQVAGLEASAKRAPIFFAPNMSVGVNVLLKLLPMLVQALGPNYDMEMTEIHHKMKKDAPSGTAVKLAQVMAEARGWDYDEVKCCGREGIIGARPQEEFGVMALRGGDVVGDHTVYFFGPGERIELTHRAHSRETFASGALRAAKWLAGKQPGKLYSMADIF